MGLIKIRSKKNKDKNSIILTITQTINDLKYYFEEIESGKVYDLSRYEEGSESYKSLLKIINIEKSNIKSSISSLESTLSIIKTNIVADLQINKEANEQNNNEI